VPYSGARGFSVATGHCAEYLEASQAVLEAVEQEVQSVCDQLVTTDSRVAGKFLLAVLVCLFLLILLLILFCMGQS
jgi:hypothetical protein